MLRGFPSCCFYLPLATHLRSPGTATDAQRADFVRAVYVNLLNREADSAGLNYWVTVLRTGASTPGLVIGNIINAAMSSGTTDWLTIRNKVEVANYFAYKFGQGRYIWDDNARAAAVMALDGVTSDPASAQARKAWIDSLMTPARAHTQGTSFSVAESSRSSWSWSGRSRDWERALTLQVKPSTSDS